MTNSDDIGRLAQSSPVLGRLSDVARRDLLSGSEEIALRPNQELMRQGEVSDSAYLVLAGELDVQVETAYGSVRLARIGPGALIGEIGALAELPRTATVRAVGTARALRLDRARLVRAGESSPALLRSVITGLGRQIGTFNGAIGFYTNALSALERNDFDLGILDQLRNPVPELMNFSHGFRRLAEQIVLRRRQHEEMASAAAIQRAILPAALPYEAVRGFDIHADMLPAREVGGDLYDVFALDPGRLVITIGDVSGKGVPASLFMAVTQTVMRLVVRTGLDLQAEVERANELLVASNTEMMFATLFCGILDTTTGLLTYCNCGHNPPLVLRKAGGEPETLPAAGPPLAIESGMVYKARSVALAPGDLLFLYTDGVSEAENLAEQQFGTGRLIQAIRDKHTAHEIVQHVLANVAEFAAGAPQSDDITCIAVKRAEV